VIAAVHVVVARVHALSLLPHPLLMAVKCVLPPMVKRKPQIAIPTPAPLTVLDRGQLGVVVVVRAVAVRVHASSLLPHLLLMVVLCVLPPTVKRNLPNAILKPALPTVLDIGQLGAIVAANVAVVRVHALSMLLPLLPMVVQHVLSPMV